MVIPPASRSCFPTSGLNLPRRPGRWHEGSDRFGRVGLAIPHAVAGLGGAPAESAHRPWSAHARPAARGGAGDEPAVGTGRELLVPVPRSASQSLLAVRARQCLPSARSRHPHRTCNNDRRPACTACRCGVAANHRPAVRPAEVGPKPVVATPDFDPAASRVEITTAEPSPDLPAAEREQVPWR